MGAIRQPIPSEDRHLVALDGIALPHIELSLDNTVESNPGASTGAAAVRAAIADPADPRAAERYRDGRACALGFLRSDRQLGRVRGAVTTPGKARARLGPAGTELQLGIRVLPMRHGHSGLHIEGIHHHDVP